MKLAEYQELSVRTIPKDKSNDELLANFSMGLTGEAGEVVDMLKKHVFHGHVLNRDEMEKELGDVLFYLAGLATILNIDLSLVALKNIEKLQKRYPNGFSEQASKNRED